MERQILADAESIGALKFERERLLARGDIEAGRARTVDGRRQGLRERRIVNAQRQRERMRGRDVLRDELLPLVLVGRRSAGEHAGDRDRVGQSFAAGDMDWEGRVVSAHHKLASMERRMSEGDRSQAELWKRYDWEFHQALISACGSRVLMDTHAGVFDKYLRYQMIALSYRGDIASNEHAELLDCALKRDAARACEVLTRHVAGGVEHALATGTIS